MHLSGLGTLTRRVSSLSRSARFYGELLGLKVHQSPEKLRVILGVGVELHLLEGPVEPAGLCLTLQVADPDLFHAQASARGLEASPPVSTPTHRRFAARDPDGLELFFESPLPRLG